MSTLVIAGTIFLLFSGIALGSQCPGREWFNRKGTSDCYFIFNPKNSGDEVENGPSAVRLNFSEAVLECQMQGGEIATFETNDELQWVEGRITDSILYYWIGLTYETGSWRWTNGNSTKPYVDIGLQPAPTTLTDSNPERRKHYRGTITYDTASRTIQFSPTIAHPSYSTHGFICKGTFSTRPWCNLENGWSYYGGKCLKFSPVGETWSAANAICAAENGHLAVIRSQMEDDRMKRWLRSYVKEENGWIGVNIPYKTVDTTVNNVKWVDGTPINGAAVNHWAGPNLTHVVESLPNGRSYCGMLRTKERVWVPDADYSWYDYGFWGGAYDPAVHEWSFTPNCTEEHPFICEAPRSNCPYGWREFENDCYKFNDDTPTRNFTDARTECQKSNSDLALIKTNEVQAFVEHTIGTEWYFDDLWIGFQGSNRSYTWIDGSSLDYTAWGDMSVDPGNNISVCGYVKNAWTSSAEIGRWGLASCTQRKGYICKTTASAQIPDETIIHPPVECEAPFKKYHEGCYLVVHEQRNRDSASQYCQDRHSILAYPTVFGENVWMKKQLTKDIWLGIRQDGTPGSWLEYLYSDGRYVETGAFTNFYWSRYDAKKPCVVMTSINPSFVDDGFIGPSLGEWYHAACTDQREFMCYHPGTPIITHTLEPDHSDPLCGAGWIRNGTNCYHISPDSARWHLAKQICQNLAPNSDLVYITTKKELAFLSEISASESSWIWSRSTYWIGFYSEERNGWHWPYRNSANKWQIPAAVTSWAHMEPDEGNISLTYDARCAMADTGSNHKWYTTSCDDDRMRYICKKTLKNNTQPQTTRAPTPSPGEQLGCSQGWDLFEGRCIRHVLIKKSWYSAEEDCRIYGGHLLTIRNENELDYINRSATGAWTGLNAVEDSGFWGPRVFIWSSGEEVLYTPWDTSSGSNVPGNDCAALTPTVPKIYVTTVTEYAHGIRIRYKRFLLGWPITATLLPSKGIAAYSGQESRSYFCERPMESVTISATTTAFPTRTTSQTPTARTATSIITSTFRTSTPYTFPTTTDRPPVEIPEYLLTPFNVTCRRGSLNLSEPDVDLVDSLTTVFDGDNTLNCRLILNDFHSWVLAKTGQMRQKRALDYEPVKIECSRGNLTISSVDPGTSESTGLVFRTGASKNCIGLYREFLSYVAVLRDSLRNF